MTGKLFMSWRNHGHPSANITSPTGDAPTASEWSVIVCSQYPAVIKHVPQFICVDGKLCLFFNFKVWLVFWMLYSFQIWYNAARIEHTTWWLHQMETFSALLVFCAGKSPVIGEFPSQRPVTRSFDVFFDLRRNKQLSKQCRRQWF